MARPSNREKVLEAAEAVAIEEGAANLTLDAVAARAGFSKGGLLYHFKDKDALLSALVARYVERFVGERKKKVQELGGDAAALLKSKIMTQCADKNACPRVQVGLLAACASNPELGASVRPHIREAMNTLRQNFKTPEDAIILWLAADGLIFHEMMRFQTFNATERKAMVDHLLKTAEKVQ